MLQELKDYGWTLSHKDSFEYSPLYERVWIHLEHTAFPEMHLCIELDFEDDLSAKASLIVEDDNIDSARDSADVLIQERFDPEGIWEACEGVMQKRMLERRR
jgi:hypothetical protein